MNKWTDVIDRAVLIEKGSNNLYTNGLNPDIINNQFTSASSVIFSKVINAKDLTLAFSLQIRADISNMGKRIKWTSIYGESEEITLTTYWKPIFIVIPFEEDSVEVSLISNELFNIGDKIEINNIQIEENNHPTSYIQGLRADENLEVKDFSIQLGSTMSIKYYIEENIDTTIVTLGEDSLNIKDSNLCFNDEIIHMISPGWNSIYVLWLSNMVIINDISVSKLFNTISNITFETQSPIYYRDILLTDGSAQYKIDIAENIKYTSNGYKLTDIIDLSTLKHGIIGNTISWTENDNEWVIVKFSLNGQEFVPIGNNRTINLLQGYDTLQFMYTIASPQGTSNATQSISNIEFKIDLMYNLSNNYHIGNLNTAINRISYNLCSNKISLNQINSHNSRQNQYFRAIETFTDNIDTYSFREINCSRDNISSIREITFESRRIITKYLMTHSHMEKIRYRQKYHTATIKEVANSMTRKKKNIIKVIDVPNLTIHTYKVKKKFEEE